LHLEMVSHQAEVTPGVGGGRQGEWGGRGLAKDGWILIEKDEAGYYYFKRVKP
jgi:hypothetical protein